MASPAAKHDYLSRLPTEILWEIGAALRDSPENPEQYTSSLAALCATSRVLRDTFEKKLYSFNIARQGPSAMIFGAFNNRIGTMEKALSYGAAVHSPGHHRSVSLDLISRVCTMPYMDFEYDSIGEPNGQTNALVVQRHLRGTPLHFAAAAGHDDVVNWLLDRFADINDTTSTALCGCMIGDSTRFDEPKDIAFSSLHHAICHGKTTTALLLLQRGAGVEIGGTEGLNAAHSAAKAGDLTVLKFLIDKFGVDIIHAKTPDTFTPLHYAVGIPGEHIDGRYTRPSTEMIEFLASMGADLESSRGGWGTPLDHAVLAQNWSAVLSLVEAGVDYTRLAFDSLLDYYLVQWFMPYRHDEESRLALLRKPGLIRIEKSYQLRHDSPQSPFEEIGEALRFDDWGMADILLDHFSSRISRHSLLHHLFKDLVRESSHHWPEFKTAAWLKGRNRVVRKLVALGMGLDTASVQLEVRGTIDISSETCLTFCVLTPDRYTEQEDVEMVSLLLELGADPNTQNEAKRTPLHCMLYQTVAETDPDVCELMEEHISYKSILLVLNHGASLDIADSDGMTPLDHAASMCQSRDKDEALRGFRLLIFLLKHVQPGRVSEDARFRAMVVLGSALELRPFEPENCTGDDAQMSSLATLGEYAVSLPFDIPA